MRKEWLETCMGRKGGENRSSILDDVRQRSILRNRIIFDDIIANDHFHRVAHDGGSGEELRTNEPVVSIVFLYLFLVEHRLVPLLAWSRNRRVSSIRQGRDDLSFLGIVDRLLRVDHRRRALRSSVRVTPGVLGNVIVVVLLAVGFFDLDMAVFGIVDENGIFDITTLPTVTGSLAGFGGDLLRWRQGALETSPSSPYAQNIRRLSP